MNEEGWLGKPKGLLQVLWERGFIDVTKLNEYVKGKRANWVDEKGKVQADCLEQYQTFSLTYLLEECPDFKNEKTALQKLCDDLSERYSRNIGLLLTPKYHCELAGEGIEYGWGYSKKMFRRLPLSEKKGKANFLKSVRKSLYNVTVEHIRKFAARARRYMLTYWYFDNRNNEAEAQKHGVSYQMIESYVNTKMKTHRSSADQDYSFIASVWRESQTMPIPA